LNDGSDSARLRVLLVEDDEDDYVIIRDLLVEIEEFDLEWVTDYDHALKAIAREEHDVCLLDYRLGERSGLELLREASGRGYGTPMILLTGQGDREVDLQAMQAGAADYLIKGRIDAPLLERAIRYAFARTLKALGESERRFRSLVQHASDIVTILENDGTVRYESPSIERVLGYDPEELIGKNAFEYIHPDELGQASSTFARVLEAPGTPGRVEFRFRHKDGSWRWLEAIGSDLRHDPAVKGVVVNSRDITDRKRAEEQVQNTLASLLALHEAGKVLGSTLEQEEIGAWLLEIMQRISGPDAVAIDLMDKAGRLRHWRATGPKDLWGSARSTPEAQTARQKVLESGDRQLCRLPRSDSLEGAQLVGLYLPLRMRDQLIGVVEAYGPEALAEKGTVETIASLAGQAASALENARLYAELAERERRMRDLVGQVLLAQEEERRHVAYEVHDGLAQTAAAAHQLLQAYVRHHAPGSPESQKNLVRVLQLVQQTVGEARDVIADLRPTVLDDFGLATAIRQQVDRISSQDRRIDYEETLGGERLPAAVETTLYRVAQEALTNIRKHASSARAEVTLQRLDGSVLLRIQDWGRGFRTDEVANGGGPGERVGLSSMRERVALLGGSFMLHSEPGAGTEIVAEVPLPMEGGEHE
jgi:PAS domain S-box-containing protein